MEEPTCLDNFGLLRWPGATFTKELTNRKLLFGMTEGDVIAVLRKPQERYLAQTVDNVGLIYEGYSLFFRQNRLDEIRKKR